MTGSMIEAVLAADPISQARFGFELLLRTFGIPVVV